MLSFHELENQAEQLVQLLIKLNKKVTVAESCTGGLVSALITSISGSSSVYDMGVCTYANSAKSKLIGVSEQTLAMHGAVSEQTAREMAEGVLKLASANYSLSITGIAGPSGGTTEKPVGTVYLACTNSIVTRVLHIIVKPPADIPYEKHRDFIRLETARQGLILLIDFIKNEHN